MNSLPVPVRAPSLERVPAPASSEPSACLTPHPSYTGQQPQTGQAQATPLVMGGPGRLTMLVLGAAAPGSPRQDCLSLGQREPGSVGCRRGALPSAGGGPGERSAGQGGVAQHPAGPPWLLEKNMLRTPAADKHAASETPFPHAGSSAASTCFLRWLRATLWPPAPRVGSSGS